MSEIKGQTCECPGCGLQARMIDSPDWLKLFQEMPCSECGNHPYKSFTPVPTERDRFLRIDRR